MAHCVNCDVLISDRPEHGDFCSPECADEYRAQADQDALAAAESNQLANTLHAINTEGKGE